MQDTTTATSVKSPKRKRDSTSEHTLPYSPKAVRLRTDLSPSVSGAVSTGNESPRTTVAGQMQALRLGHELASPLAETQSPERPVSIKASHAFQNGAERPRISSSSDTTASEIHPSFADAAVTPPRIPSTPRLKPVTPSPARTISPLPRARRKSPPPPPRSPSPSPLPDSLGTEFLSTSELSRSSNSPPPSPPSALEVENLGLNGIGFRPTPAMAYARAQRRKQQLAEWKSREAREARQRRSELRRKRDETLGDGPVRGLSMEREGGLEEMKVRRVRFVEG
ncbi:hypothetical protein MMC13_005730 [Lambiella insularis]|nr:hypothetical protein [Lambiella insularis]